MKLLGGGTGFRIRLVDGKEVYDGEEQVLPHEIEHMYPDYSLYPELTKDTAYGFLTRGCPRDCGFCHVSQKEGRKSYKVADLSEFWDGQKNLVLMDANILACTDHIDLLTQVRDSKASTDFNQGIDIRMITDRNIEILKDIRMKTIHFAYDNYKDRKLIEHNLQLFKDRTGYDKSKGGVMVYILVNYDTTLEQDIKRIQFCRSLNFAPYVMIYDKTHCDPIYKRLQRWANNYYIFWKCESFDEYRGNKK